MSTNNCMWLFPGLQLCTRFDEMTRKSTPLIDESGTWADPSTQCQELVGTHMDPSLARFPAADFDLRADSDCPDIAKPLFDKVTSSLRGYNKFVRPPRVVDAQALIEVSIYARCSQFEFIRRKRSLFANDITTINENGSIEGSEEK